MEVINDNAINFVVIASRTAMFRAVPASAAAVAAGFSDRKIALSVQPAVIPVCLAYR